MEFYSKRKKNLLLTWGGLDVVHTFCVNSICGQHDVSIGVRMGNKCGKP